MQMMYYKNHDLAKWSIFIRCVIYSLACTTSPLDPSRPLYMLYMSIGTYHCPKGILGLGGKHLKQTEIHQFHLSNDKRRGLNVFRTHAQKEYGKVLEIKSTSILTFLQFYFLKTNNAFTQSLV